MFVGVIFNYVSFKLLYHIDLIPTFCITECISRLIKMTDCNNAQWKFKIIILPNNSRAFALFSLSGKPYDLGEKRTEQFSPQPLAEPLFVFINI